MPLGIALGTALGILLKILLGMSLGILLGTLQGISFEKVSWNTSRTDSGHASRNASRKFVGIPLGNSVGIPLVILVGTP